MVLLCWETRLHASSSWHKRKTEVCVIIMRRLYKKKTNKKTPTQWAPVTHEKLSDVGFVSHHSRAWTFTLARVESCYVQAEMAHSFSILAPHLFSTAAAFARLCATAAPWWTGTGAFWYMEFCSDGLHSGLQASDMYGSTPGLKTNCSRALSSYDLTFHNFCLPLIFLSFTNHCVQQMRSDESRTRRT